MTKKQQRSLWSQLPQWAWKQGLRTNVDFAQHPDSAAAPADAQRQLPEHCSDIKTAQVITSKVEYPDATDMHKPVLDIDFPAQLVPSTTPGHFHLYLDHEMTWTKYKALLSALANAGIIEPGYRDASIARGYTSVRLPWVRKEEQPEAPAPAATPAAETRQSRAEALGSMAAADPVLRNLQQVYAERPIGQDFGPPPFPVESRVRYNGTLRRFEGGGMYVTEQALARANTTLRDQLHDAPPITSAAWRNASRIYGHPMYVPAGAAVGNAGAALGDALVANAHEQAQEAARAARLPGPWNPPPAAGRESWQALVEQHRTGPAPLRAEAGPGPHVRYDPASMSYTDGTNRVPIRDIRDYERTSGSDVEGTIQRGNLPASSPIWRSLLAEYGDRISTDRRPRPSFRGVDRSADVRNQLMEAEARIARQETIDRDRQRQQGIRSPRVNPSIYEWTAEPRPVTDSRLTVEWSEQSSDPLGDIIEFRDRIAAAPPVAPSVAEPNVPF